MRNRVVVASGIVAFVMAGMAPAFAAAQAPSRDQVEEAARKASFRSEEEAAN